MLVRRLLIALAVLIGLTALASGVSPREPTVREDQPATPSPGGAQSPAAAPIETTLNAGESGQRVVARVGQTVIITVEGAALDTVRLAEFGNETVDRDSPARFELLADVPGTYEIELLESDRRIGTLKIRPPEPTEPSGVQS